MRVIGLLGLNKVHMKYLAVESVNNCLIFFLLHIVLKYLGSHLDISLESELLTGKWKYM